MVHPVDALESLRQLLDFNILSTRGEVKLAPEPDFSRCRPVRLPDGTYSGVKDHVKVGVRALLANPYFFLADEMGAMKSAQTIIAAQHLFTANIIDRVVVIAPASVRDVWYDKDLGELSLHLWENLPARVSEYHAKIRQWDHGDWSGAGQSRQLRWIISNYEFIGRSTERLKTLMSYCGPRTLLVLDESSAVKSKTTQQSKACLKLRKRCGRVVLLNGTPIADTLLDLLNQANIMDVGILGTPTLTQFRDTFCIMRPGVDYPVIDGWKNIDVLQKRLAPYVLRRLKRQCLDLPPLLPPVTRTIVLDPPTWRSYKEMKDDLIVWVKGSTQASVAGQAITKVLRLAQITSGFVGGVEELIDDTDDDVPLFMQEENWFEVQRPLSAFKLPDVEIKEVHELSREKLDDVLEFYAAGLKADPAFKLLIWCRFRPELDRLYNEMAKRFPQVRLAKLVGGQKRDERTMALHLLHPRTCVFNEPAVLIGTYGTGSMGHNFTAASVTVNMSYDYSLFKYKQAMARIDRPGQTSAVSSHDLEAVGPQGQQTIDHHILKVRKNKDDVATFTAQAWLDVLRAEHEQAASA